MKMINIKQLRQTLLGAVSMALVLCSCAEGFAPDPEPDPTPGGGTNAPLEMVSVPLNLSIEASGGVSKAPRTTQWTEGAMDVELTEGPIEEPQGKALAGESAIINVWILQFAGTETTSELILKTYLPGYVTNAKVELIKATAANRVVVLCNTFDLAFADGFTTNTTTYGQVAASAKMTRAVTASSGVFVSNGSGTEYIPMYGVYDGTILGSSAAISVARTVAKVVLKVRSGVGFDAIALAVSMCDVPNVMNWIPAGTGVYPASPTTVDFPAVGISGVNATTYKEATFWVPVNRRGVVAGTTEFARATNAPAKSTYLNMIANGSASFDRLFDVTYKLHLGGDFLTDYNVKHNTQYTYTVTLQRDLLGSDSRVSDVEYPLVGRFGGTLAANAAGVWQFSSLLYADVSDASKSVTWATTTVVTGTNQWDGKGNTWLLNKSAALASLVGYPAANLCFKKNAGWAALTSAADVGYVWYLPAQAQLTALWVAHSSFAAAHKLGSAYYWSATEDAVAHAWVVHLDYGSANGYSKSSTTSLRCVREVSE